MGMSPGSGEALRFVGLFGAEKLGNLEPNSPVRVMELVYAIDIGIACIQKADHFNTALDVFAKVEEAVRKNPEKYFGKRS
jgi:hypothetical protein